MGAVPPGSPIVLPNGKCFFTFGKPIRVAKGQKRYESTKLPPPTYIEITIGAREGLARVAEGLVPIPPERIESAQVWPEENVVDAVTTYIGDCTIVRQIGVFEGVEEPSYRVIVYYNPDDRPDEDAFIEDILDKTERLGRNMAQKELIARVVRSGEDKGIVWMSWKDK